MLIKFIAGMMAAGIALSGGYIPKEEILPPEVVVTIEPDVEDLSEITVKAWDKEIEDEIIAAVLKKTGGLQFLDVDGNVLMEGNTKNIEGAKATFGPVDAYGEPKYYVTVYFTQEGQAAFKAATEATVKKMPEGGNYIAIVVDGTVYSNPAVYEVIDADNCIITGGFDKETAAELANIINSGLLEFDLKIVK